MKKRGQIMKVNLVLTANKQKQYSCISLTYRIKHLRVETFTLPSPENIKHLAKSLLHFGSFHEKIFKKYLLLNEKARFFIHGRLFLLTRVFIQAGATYVHEIFTYRY